ncbi:MAG: hypothetical protein ACLQBK_03790 [Candidatus Sulfotelmatobacter sp.]
MRHVRRIVLGAVIFAVAVPLGVHLYAQIFRIRAEHLLADLKAFQVEETPAAAVLKLRSEYRSETVDQGACSEEHCDFWVGLIEWESLMRPSSHEWVEQPRELLMRVLRPVGLRLSLFDAHLQVEKGKLRKLDVEFMHAYVEQERFPNFIADAFTVGNLRYYLGWKYVYEHPNLFVDEPNACTGCSGAIAAYFTWQATRNEFERAMEFDFSCITRFHVCRAVEEFLPSAARLLKADDASLSANMGWKLPCDTRAARILGRDSDLVELARVKQIKGKEGEYVIVDYEPIRALKGENIQLNNVYHRSELAEAVTTNHGSSQRLLQVGAKRVVFFSTLLDKPSAMSECAVMPNTTEILTATLEGIAADRSATIGKE